MNKYLCILPRCWVYVARVFLLARDEEHLPLTVLTLTRTRTHPHTRAITIPLRLGELQKNKEKTLNDSGLLKKTDSEVVGENGEQNAVRPTSTHCASFPLRPFSSLAYGWKSEEGVIT